ncbi:MAG: agmatinase [Rhodothermales bacterium]
MYTIDTMITTIGIPFDQNSSFMQGPANAPGCIRNALHAPSSNLSTERGDDLSNHPRLLDVGDINPPEHGDWFSAITENIDALLAQHHQVLSLGGDHSVTYPIVKAFAAHHQPLTILHLDAHPDLYDELDGNRHSHACPFARIMEEGLASRLVQVGIRTMNAHQRAQAERFGVEVFEMRCWQDYKRVPLEGAVYLSVDMDVLDPAFAPGVSHHEPGGLSTRDVLNIIHDIERPLVGADIVELNPSRDLQDVTAMAAAKVMKEIISNMLLA